MRPAPDLVVVLCPGDPKIVNGTVEVPETDSFGYLGSSIRLRAAVKLYTTWKTTTFVLVGGTTNRVKAMKAEILRLQRDTDPFGTFDALSEERIIMVVSAPDTCGNFLAIKGLVISGAVKPKSIGILTNCYHHHRATLMALDILKDFSIVPLPAEAFVEKGFECWTKEALDKRMELEMQGVSDWLSGAYHDQNWAGELFYKIVP